MTEFVDPYIDLEHGCLHNLLGIIDPVQLAIVEASIVAVRLQQLDNQRNALPTTVTTWCAVHRHLFADVYSWAGHSGP